MSTTTRQQRQIVLRERPTGEIGPSTTEVIEGPIPTCEESQALVRVGLLSIDPTIRTWMDDAPGYLPPIGLGRVIRGVGAGVVVESRHPGYRVGDVVTGVTGWQEFVIADDRHPFTVVPKGLGVDLPTVLNVLGTTGLTAYFGLRDVGRFTAGDAVLVSGAAGATGSVVGQLARAGGASRVIGVAGGPEKCALAVAEFGYDACIDYRRDDVRGALASLVPNGVDLFFDNVGGAMLESGLDAMARHGRVVLCGAIDQYNATSSVAGPRNLTQAIFRRLTLRGFIVFDFADRYAQAQSELAALVRSGALHHREELTPGLDAAPRVLAGLFRGENRGKALVVVDPDVTLD